MDDSINMDEAYGIGMGFINGDSQNIEKPKDLEKPTEAATGHDDSTIEFTNKFDKGYNHEIGILDGTIAEAEEDYEYTKSLVDDSVASNIQHMKEIGMEYYRNHCDDFSTEEEVEKFNLINTIWRVIKRIALAISKLFTYIFIFFKRIAERFTDYRFLGNDIKLNNEFNKNSAYISIHSDYNYCAVNVEKVKKDIIYSLNSIIYLAHSMKNGGIDLSKDSTFLELFSKDFPNIKHADDIEVLRSLVRTWNEKEYNGTFLFEKYKVFENKEYGNGLVPIKKVFISYKQIYDICNFDADSSISGKKETIDFVLKSLVNHDDSYRDGGWVNPVVAKRNAENLSYAKVAFNLFYQYSACINKFIVGMMRAATDAVKELSNSVKR